LSTASKSYERLLDRAKAVLPTEAPKSERFKLPRLNFAVVGNRTILYNFRDICGVINRDQQHLMRFLSKEMATAGSIEEARATFQGKFNEGTIMSLLERYLQEYVTCPVCGRPDTKIKKENRFVSLVCEACGAKSPVRPV
jgi:translation initiation factor 2 subunit 2